MSQGPQYVCPRHGDWVVVTRTGRWAGSLEADTLVEVTPVLPPGSAAVTHPELFWVPLEELRIIHHDQA